MGQLLRILRTSWYGYSVFIRWRMICVWPQFSVWSCCPFCLLPFFVVVVVVCFYPPLGCRLGQNVDHLSSAKLSSSARHPARNGERVGTHSVCNSLQKKIDGFLTESSLTQRIGKQQRLVGALAWFFCKGHFFFVSPPSLFFFYFVQTGKSGDVFRISPARSIGLLTAWCCQSSCSAT